jgi:hypothetical protein
MRSASISVVVVVAQTLAAILVSAAVLPSSAVADFPVYFAEPYSGKKTTRYTVELPVGRDDRRTFEIPGDCAEVTRAAVAGASRWGTRIERNVWWKVETDCRYYAFLNRHGVGHTRDFVTGYDFFSAYLRDLPIGAGCRQAETGSDSEPVDSRCRPLPPGVPGLSHFLPFADRGAEVPPMHAEPCQLEDGIFRGRIVRDASGIHCEADPDAPGFRVISVDYADVNGDQVLDVVLRLVPLAPGASRIPQILPLTRTSPDDAFSVPDKIEIPPGGRMP